jgi:multiple sugar transport system permease protein
LPYRLKRQLFGLVLVLPAVVLLGVFFFAPVLLTAVMSLQNWPILGPTRFVGLQNYATLADPNIGFLDSAIFTVQFAALVTPLVFGVGLLLALLLESGHRYIALVRTTVFLPVALGFAATSYLWLALLNQRSGLIGRLLKDLGVVSEPVNWFVDPGVALVIAVAVTAWKSVGFSMVAMMNGLHSIPGEYEEAAKIDGAGPLQVFLWVKLPLLRESIAFVTTFVLIGAFLTFDQFYILTGGGPANSTMTLIYRIYNTSFIRGQLGFGAAMSLVFLLIVGSFTGAQLYLLRRGRTS